MIKTVVVAAALGALCVSIGSAQAYEAGEVEGGGTISGVVKFNGAPPPRENIKLNEYAEACGKGELPSPALIVGSAGGMQNAVVFLTNVTNGKRFQTATATIDQKGCQHVPHVVLSRTGASVDILNSDGILHNVHTVSSKNPALNLAQPKFKKTMKLKFDQPEIVKVKCDAHRWMGAVVVVEDHPYYAVSDENGAFKLTDVPPGDYELKIWHEMLGEKTQQVSVKGGEEAQVNFELSLPKLTVQGGQQAKAKFERSPLWPAALAEIRVRHEAGYRLTRDEAAMLFRALNELLPTDRSSWPREAESEHD